MLVYSETGKTKTGELRITRPIGTLLIKTDKTIDTLVNETITIFIERANGSNVEIATNIQLKAFVLASVYGTASYDGKNGVSALCEIANGGAIELGTNESIKVKLDNLNPANTYQINGIELPLQTSEIVKFERKTVLADETNRVFDVTNFDEAVINGIDAIDECNVRYLNGNVVKYTAEEMKAIAFDVDPILGTTNTGTVLTELLDCIIFPIVGVKELDIYKSTGTITLTLRDENHII